MCTSVFLSAKGHIFEAVSAYQNENQAADWLQQKSADASHLAIALVYKQCSSLLTTGAGKNVKHDKHLTSILNRL